MSTVGKESAAMQETPVRFLGWEDLLENIENRFVVTKGKGRWGKEWIGSLALANANYYIYLEWINSKVLLCSLGNYI